MRDSPEPHLVPTRPVRPSGFSTFIPVQTHHDNRNLTLEHPTLRNTTRLTERTEMNHAKRCLLNHLEHRSQRESSAPRAHRLAHPWLDSVPPPHPRATDYRIRTLQALRPALERVGPIPSPRQHSCRLTKRTDTNLHNLLDDNRLKDDAQEQSSAPEAHRRRTDRRTVSAPRLIQGKSLLRTKPLIFPKQVPQTPPSSTLPASQHPGILANNRLRNPKNVPRNKRTRLLTNS